MSAANPASNDRTLRRLFLMLFLRGRTSRGLRRDKSPGSIASKLWLTLLFYALFGLVALALFRQPLFALAVYLHASSFLFVGMFVASSSGEILFNKEEAEILLHRPVTPAELLRAKSRVLVEVSLWLAGAFNLAGVIVGVFGRDGAWVLPIAHGIALAFESIFCTGCVVITYQLCLRWFGREKLEGLMTTVQVLVSISVVLAGQIVPRVMFRFGNLMDLNVQSDWAFALPPAWFAGMDMVLVGRLNAFVVQLASLGVVATCAVIFFAHNQLAHDYERGLQNLTTTISERRPKASRRWIDLIVNAPPMRWWLRDPAERASFMLCVAYMVRDRDMKLRLYPGLAPTFILPVIFVLQGKGISPFMGAFAGGFVAQIPTIALGILSISQQWQAADFFRVAPLYGPAALCHGARRAAICVLGVPSIIVCTSAIWLITGQRANLLLLLPGIILMPVLTMLMCRDGNAIPLSRPTEEARSAGRGLIVIAAMFGALALSGIAYWAFVAGWFAYFLIGEIILALLVYYDLRRSLDMRRWRLDM